MPKSLTALLILTLLPLFAKTQADPREQLNIVGSPTVYDSVVASWRTDNINETFGDYLRDYIELDTTRYLPAVSTVTDNVCRTRLKNMVSPIYLPYNDIVKKHIVAYATTHKSVTRRMLSYGKYYFPMIEHELAKNGLPLEKIIKNIVQVCFIRPKVRPYETDNFYAVLQRQDILDKEVYRIVSGKNKVKPRRQKAD